MTTPACRVEIGVAHRLAQRYGLVSWPVALQLHPTCDDAGRAECEALAADRMLVAAGLADGRGLSAWIDDALGVVDCPDAELEIRVLGRPLMARACVSRRGRLHVVTSRDGTHVDLSMVGVADVGALGDLIRYHLLPRMLGSREALEFDEFACPTQELFELLSDVGAPSTVASALRTAGAGPRDATRLATALVTGETRAEMVAVNRDDGAVAHSAAAVGIIDSDGGRILFSPSKSPDGRVWTTITPGGDRRIGRAIAGLIETLPGGWGFT